MSFYSIERLTSESFRDVIGVRMKISSWCSDSTDSRTVFSVRFKCDKGRRTKIPASHGLGWKMKYRRCFSSVVSGSTILRNLSWFLQLNGTRIDCKAPKSLFDTRICGSYCTYTSGIGFVVLLCDSSGGGDEPSCFQWRSLAQGSHSRNEPRKCEVGEYE